MSKTKINNYTFDKVAKTVTFTDYTTIRLDCILIIVNTTSNVIMYNFINPSLGGTVNNNVLTLAFNTSSMSNTDKLLIYYDDVEAEQLVSDLALRESVTDDLTMALRRLTMAIMYPPTIDRTSNSLRVNLPGTSTIAISSNQDIRNITGGLTMLDIYYARQAVLAMNYTSWNQCVRSRIS